MDWVILAVGSIGTGKSTFGKSLGAMDIQPGDGANSVTQETTIHTIGIQDEEDPTHIRYIKYIDTGGFDDSNRDIKDDKRQRQVLECLKTANQSYVTTLLWFCNPNIRMSARLQEEAAFISSIAKADTSVGGNVWRNVIIIVKKGREIQGPLEAAKEARASVEEVAKKARASLEATMKVNAAKQVALEDIPVVPLWIMEEESDPVLKEHYESVGTVKRLENGHYYKHELLSLLDTHGFHHPQHRVNVSLLRSMWMFFRLSNLFYFWVPDLLPERALSQLPPDRL